MSVQGQQKNIYQRVLGIMAEIKYIQKGDKKVNGQYSFVSHDQVTGTLHPAFVEHGIVVIPNVVSLSQEGNRTSVCLRTDFINADNPSDKIEVISWGYGIDPQDKGPGKAVSYAYKYALLKTFCLETGDDPDMDAKSEYEAPKAQNEESKEETITPKQLGLLTSLLKNFDKEQVQKLEAAYEKESKITCWEELPKSKFQNLYDQLVARLNTKTKKVA